MSWLIFRREVESHARKLISAEWIVGHAQAGSDEASHGADVASDGRVTEGHEAEADARGDETGDVDHGAHALGKDWRVGVRLLVVLTVLALVGQIVDCGLQSRGRCMLSHIKPP